MLSAKAGGFWSRFDARFKISYQKNHTNIVLFLGYKMADSSNADYTTA